MVVADPGASLNAQHIDPAHITEDILSQIMDFVELDPVFFADRIHVAPGPAAGDPGVIEIVDLIVFHQRSPDMAQHDPGTA